MKNIELGMTREEVVAILGEPQMAGGTSRKYPVPSIYVYPTQELVFEPWKNGSLIKIKQYPNYNILKKLVVALEMHLSTVNNYSDIDEYLQSLSTEARKEAENIDNEKKMTLDIVDYLNKRKNELQNASTQEEKDELKRLETYTLYFTNKYKEAEPNKFIDPNLNELETTVNRAILALK
jgi:hypothetical protein